MVMETKIILNKENLADEEAQAYKRFGEYEHEKVSIYLEGLQDGAKWYRR